MSVALSEHDRSLLGGHLGAGTALAMRILVATAEAMGATRLLDIEMAHIDGCLNHGQVSLDFVERLVEGGSHVSVPTTLNVGSLDLLHPELVAVGPGRRAMSRRIMEAYEALGATPTWTCAPYQAGSRPAFGAQIAWAESNAIVFANSVLGARTERYGDFIDACAAITGRAPEVGLHTDDGRQPTLAVDVVNITFDDETAYPLIGLVLGARVGSEVAFLRGLPRSTGEDDLKALGAAAASSGSVAMFHAEGLTPEAPVASVGADLPAIEIGPDDLKAAAAALVTSRSGSIDAVSLGGPHYSRKQLKRLITLMDGVEARIPLFVNTSRHALAALTASQVQDLEEAGVCLVTDTCTYLAPIIGPGVDTVMTDSAKWAYYAPTNIGVGVVFGSVEACVAAATGTA